MLDAVMQAVSAQGWFDVAQAYERSIYTSRGASLWMVLTRRGQPDTFVKFSDLVDLEQESTRCSEASRCFPEQAPQFLGFARAGALNVLATRAMEFEAVTVDNLGDGPVVSAVRTGLRQFFQQSRTLSVEPGSTRNRPWLEAMHAYYADHALSSLALPALSRLGQMMLSLRGTPQHGDLVMNNLGVRKNGVLAIFDWEDFGSIWLPGLDLFTLEYSFGQEEDWARQRGGPGVTRQALDVDEMLRSLGLSIDEMNHLRLPCALAFRYLKRNYGPDIQARLDQYILSQQGIPAA
jgi:hypothetical protein